MRVPVNVWVATLAAYQCPHVRSGITCDAVQPIGHDECTRVDERVAWFAVLLVKLQQRVERVARGFARHSSPDLIAVVRHHKSEAEDFRNALDRELDIAVPDHLDE